LHFQKKNKDCVNQLLTLYHENGCCNTLFGVHLHVSSYIYDYNCWLTFSFVFLFFQCSVTNVQRNGAVVNATPSETDLLPQGADRLQQVSSHNSPLNQTRKLFYKNFCGCLQKGVNLLTKEKQKKFTLFT